MTTSDEAHATVLGPADLERLREILPPDDGSIPFGDYRLAAVLIALFVREDTVHVVLTKRTDTVRTHQGQVSFPGGSWEEGDRSLVGTALREAFEEVGLREQDVEVIGVLDDLPTNVSGFWVRPVVASVPHPYEFVHDVAEVDHVFSPPLGIFADRKRRRDEFLERDGTTYTVHFYEVDGNIVWGATARMIVQLLEKLGFSVA